jgi:PRC-barrel domain
VKKIITLLALIPFLSLAIDAHSTLTGSLANKEGLPTSLTRLIGMEVKNPAGDILGMISDFALDPIGLPFAVLYQGSIEDFDVARYVLVPFNSFSVSGTKRGEKAVILNIDRQRLLAAPPFDRSKVMNMSLGQWEKIYRYFGQVPFWQEQEEDAGWDIASR